MRIILHGSSGKMGTAITELAQNKRRKIVAGIDKKKREHLSYPVYEDLSCCTEDADVLIDFSNAQATDDLLEWCVFREIPLVLCTTGLSEDQVEKVRLASKKIPILYSANMSLGINVLGEVVREVSKKLLPIGFDVEILEKHHRTKMDAPSGTAIFFANSMNEALEYKYIYTYNRNNSQKRRAKNEIGIASIRGGTITGEHEIIFAGEDEVVTFSHTAYSRRVFAKGALEAAEFLVGKPPGLYCMKEVIEGL